MKNSKIILIGFMSMLLMAVCCGRRSHDPRLERIWVYVSDKPKEAMAALDSIDVTSMSEADRAFYNLISIKAKDKAYVLHTSDSLILTVIDHYSRHKEDGLYAEALYYGGRVYSDLGDYPTALHYFQEALNLLPENTPHLRLRGNVLSQTGGLLNDMGLYSEAIPYIRRVLTINRQMKDSVNLILNHKMLGAIFLHMRRYNDAFDSFKVAENLSAHNFDENIPEIKMYMAAIKLYEDDIKSALEIIRHVPEQSDSLTRNIMLAYASRIYYKSGVLDTAYMYAHELASSNILDNRKTGYMIMLSPEIKHLIPKDSLGYFYDDYKQVLEIAFRHQENNHALIQNAMYNYKVHDRKKREAERLTDRIIIFVVALIAVISILCVCILWLLYNRKRNLLKLHEALAKLDFIENAQDSKEFSVERGGIEQKSTESEVSQIIKDEKTLKEELRNKYKIIKDKAQSYDISQRILSSRPISRLQSLVKSQSPLPNEHNIFIELEGVIEECYPDFKLRLQLLADGNLREEDFQLCMLIRCGFSPKELSILLGRSNSTVSYRRKKLCVKLLGEDLDLEAFDAIIRLV